MLLKLNLVSVRLKGLFFFVPNTVPVCLYWNNCEIVSKLAIKGQVDDDPGSLEFEVVLFEFEVHFIAESRSVWVHWFRSISWPIRLKTHWKRATTVTTCAILKNNNNLEIFLLLTQIDVTVAVLHIELSMWGVIFFISHTPCHVIYVDGNRFLPFSRTQSSVFTLSWLNYRSFSSSAVPL